jgi:hypothetical protein
VALAAAAWKLPALGATNRPAAFCSAAQFMWFCTT